MADHTRLDTAAASKAGDVARSETTTLIAADKVEGTNVYDTGGNKLGSIDTLMIDKRSGRVAYAVLAAGGFLGMGQSHYPLPWEQLDYDTRLDGYVVAVTEAQLKTAPHADNAASMNWADRAWTGRIDDHYRAGAATASPKAPGIHDAGIHDDPSPSRTRL
jgi:sporulation protein YlmC with PRC-barrel domain